MERLLDFGGALNVLREGGAVSREGWNAGGQSVVLQMPDDHSLISLPYLYLRTGPDNRSAPNRRVPWAPSQTDLLAEDWIEVE